MNLLLSRLGGPNAAGMPPSRRTGWGTAGERLVAQITGLDEKTIRRGQEEVAAVAGRRADQAACGGPGAGRPPVEKKIRPS